MGTNEYPDPRAKHKASSTKLRKFQATSFRGLDQDKTIYRMSHMIGNLVWREVDFVTRCYFKF